jgi:hypothetical protein
MKDTTSHNGTYRGEVLATDCSHPVKLGKIANARDPKIGLVQRSPGGSPRRPRLEYFKTAFWRPRTDQGVRTTLGAPEEVERYDPWRYNDAVNLETRLPWAGLRTVERQRGRRQWPDAACWCCRVHYFRAS